MFLNYVNNIRGVAILFVILAHCFSCVPSQGWGILEKFSSNFAVPFVGVAGFLFAVLLPKYTYRAYIFGKFKYVVLPYIFMSIPAIAIYMTGVKSTHTWVDMDWFTTQLNPVQQYFYLMITGAHLGPMWFVPMVILFYPLFPVFRWMKDKGWLGGIFILAFCGALFVGRPWYNSNVLQAFVYYMPAYLAGIWLAENRWAYENVRLDARLVIFLVISFMLISYASLGGDSRIDLVMKLVLFWGLLCFFYHYVNKPIPFLSVCASLSFYLVYAHGYLTGAIRMLYQKDVLSDGGIFLVGGAFILVLAISIGSYYLLASVLGDKKRYFLGA